MPDALAQWVPINHHAICQQRAGEEDAKMSEASEMAALIALQAHEASLVEGARVRITRGRLDGLVGVIMTTDGEQSNGRVRSVHVDGYPIMTVETRRIALI